MWLQLMKNARGFNFTQYLQGHFVLDKKTKSARFECSTNRDEWVRGYDDNFD